MKPENPETAEGCEEERSLEFGTCCTCGKSGQTVRNILMLPRKAPVPGTGWGCVVCGLPSDGALSVLCDDCLGEQKEPRFAILDFALKQLRIPLEEISKERFDHDLQKHRNFELLMQPAKGEA